MADFVAVLKKTLGGLGETTPEIRARVYDKARATIASKLAALDPQPPEAVAERQKKMLEDAIATVERDYAPPPPPPEPEIDPLAELENIFSSIDRNKNQQTHTAPAVSAPVIGRTPPAAAPAPMSAPAPAPARSEPAAPTPAAFPAGTPASPLSSEKPVLPPAAPAPAEDIGAKPFSDRAEPVSRAEPFRYEPEVDAGEADIGPDRSPAANAYPQDDDDELFDIPPEPPVDRQPELAFDFEEERGRRSYRGLIIGLLALLVLGGGGYAAWLNKDALGDAFGTMFASSDGDPKPIVVKPVKVPPPAENTADAQPATPAPAPAPASPAATGNGDGSEKFTQRLLPDGKETDPGPAGGGSSIGEGSSVVALTTPPPSAAPDSSQPAAPSQAQQAQTGQAGVAVGQKAIYYEERTNVAQGSAEPGNVVWSLVQESPGGDEPPEPAIRGEVQVPGKEVQLRFTIRRNADDTLPASHIIEMIFLTPDGFEGGGIDNVLRIALKAAEQEAGNPLIGIPAKIADGYFLVALNDTKADQEANLSLLRNQEWIDVPVIYKSGRRALLTMEKGIPGDKVFDEAIKAWQAKASGQ